jgi:MFS transporter, MHS family, proline/betaine transporter
MKLSTELSETPADASAGHVVPWRKIAAITLGNGLEFFDFSIYTYFATILGRRFFPVGDPMTELLISLAAFGVGFLVRPLGGVVLGIYADRAGRKAALRLTLWLMALGSALFVATPDYSHIGIAAPIMLVFGRLIQGFALGGEVGASTSMLLEYAAENNRAYFCSWQLFSQALSTLVGSFVAIVATNTMSPQDLEGWGWRVPFLVGLLLIPLGSYIRTRSTPRALCWLQERADPRHPARRRGIFGQLYRVALSHELRGKRPAPAVKDQPLDIVDCRGTSACSYGVCG